MIAVDVLQLAQLIFTYPGDPSTLAPDDLPALVQCEMAVWDYDLVRLHRVVSRRFRDDPAGSAARMARCWPIALTGLPDDPMTRAILAEVGAAA